MRRTRTCRLANLGAPLRLLRRLLGSLGGRRLLRGLLLCDRRLLRRRRQLRLGLLLGIARGARLLQLRLFGCLGRRRRLGSLSLCRLLFNRLSISGKQRGSTQMYFSNVKSGSW